MITRLAGIVLQGSDGVSRVWSEFYADAGPCHVGNNIV